MFVKISINLTQDISQERKGNLILVISGADLVGKSTFVQACVNRLQSEAYALPHMAHHLSRPSKYFDYYHDYIDRMCVTSVWDRFHLDSLAYRYNDDHPCSMTPLKWDLVQAQFKLKCGFQVVLYASSQQITERFENCGDPMYSLEHIQKVNDTFLGIASKGSIIVRDQAYLTNIDMLGKVTEEDLVTRVCKAYVKRLTEFATL